MKHFRQNIWQENEYLYEAAYGFQPNLRAYLHEDDTVRKCMLVVPGGGYCMCTPHEGELPAMEFYRQGMNVFVLTYTTDITMSVPLRRQPMEDLSRAVRLIRKCASEYRIDPGKLLLCGFSAGSHLSACLCTHFEDIVDPDPQYQEISNRPEGAILGYPVITSGEYAHIYSIQALVGKNASEAELEYFSLEKQVKENTPPCFLWQTLDDNLVPVENSYLFADALRAKKIPHAHYVFPTGFHGLSVANFEMFSGWCGGGYTCEQLNLALEHIKDNTAVNVSEERRAELMEQFFSPKRDESPELDAGPKNSIPPEERGKMLGEDLSCWDELPADHSKDPNPFADVHHWIQLAQIWYERFL